MAEQTLLKMDDVLAGVISGDQRYMIANIMDLYRKLPVHFQKAFIEFFTQILPGEPWQNRLNDEVQYISAIRAIAVYHTGQETKFSMEAFRERIGSFLDSKFYEDAVEMTKDQIE